MIKRIKELLDIITDKNDAPKEQKVVSIDPQVLQELVEEMAPKEPDLRTIGIFTDVESEKIAELVHGLLYLNETNKMEPDPEKHLPVDFYISTYGGSADDMFALYDIMRQVKETTEIHTIGMGKVMSAGVLLLAAGTKGKRKIGKYCRVMIHSVIGGSHGSLPNLANEMEAMQQIQKDYIQVLVEETSMTKKQLKNMLERKVNVYLSAEEAVELGIADEII